MLALWIALAAIGGILKVPVGFGSIALDSAPAILASLFLGPMAGGLVAGAGHFLSALTGGFPLGPFHLIIALEMAGLTIVFALLYRKSKVCAFIAFWLGNGLLLPLPFLLLIGQAFYITIAPSLLIGALCNIGVTILVLPKLQANFSAIYKMEG